MNSIGRLGLLRDRGQLHLSGHFMGSWSSPMAFGLAALASPLDELSAFALLHPTTTNSTLRWMGDTFISTDCGGSQPNAMGWLGATHRVCCRIKRINQPTYRWPAI